jgi:hypothetical protein
MRFENRAHLPAGRFAEIENAFPRDTTMLGMLHWAWPGRGGLAISQVVNQDEYSLDVVVPWRDGLTLALEAT